MRGVMAEAAPFDYAGIGKVIDDANEYAEEHDGRALVVLRDDLTDAGNLGAISQRLRSGGRIGPGHPQQAQRARRGVHVQKLGGRHHARRPWRRCPTSCRPFSACRKSGFWARAAPEHTDDVVWDANLKGKIAIVLGNEHDGAVPPGARALRTSSRSRPS